MFLLQLAPRASFSEDDPPVDLLTSSMFLLQLHFKQSAVWAYHADCAKSQM